MPKAVCVTWIIVWEVGAVNGSLVAGDFKFTFGLGAIMLVLVDSVSITAAALV